MFDPIHPAGPGRPGSSPHSTPQSYFLRDASATYVRQLRRGLSLVLNGILLMVALMVVVMVIMFVMAAMAGAAGGPQPNPSTSYAYSGIAQLIILIPSAMMIIGYWKYTEPDPGYLGQGDPGTARKILRMSTAANALLTVVNAAMSFAGVNLNVANAIQSGVIDQWVIVSIVLGLVGLVVWIAQYLAAMKYTSWIAMRLPDPAIQKKAEMYMWLLPVIYVLGFACMGLGPLIALVLYWNLLDKVRKQLKALTPAGA
jgi:hypothetical protein